MSVMMSINHVQFCRTMSANKELVAVVDGIELVIMQEMASCGKSKWARSFASKEGSGVRSPARVSKIENRGKTEAHKGVKKM